jgi:hypothetical protein
MVPVSVIVLSSPITAAWLSGLVPPVEMAECRNAWLNGVRDSGPDGACVCGRRWYSPGAWLAPLLPSPDWLSE